MNQDTLQPETPSPPRFQFRLRSLFILMMITAFSLGVVPVWYQQVIIPDSLSGIPQPSDPDDPYEYQSFETEISNIYTPFICFVGFVSSCGLWYAFVSLTKSRSDLWLGLAFGLTLGFVLFPRVWAIPYMFQFDVSLAPLDLNLLLTDHRTRYMNVFFIAVIYSFWPLLLKRYLATLLLFLYSCFYGVIVSSYAIKIIISRLY